MSFKYIDPGYGWGFYQSRIYNVTSNVYNPKHGVAFYNRDIAQGCIIHLTDSSAKLTDLYLKFDIFLPETGYSTSEVYNTTAHSLIRIIQNDSDFKIEALDDDNLTLNDEDGDFTNLKAGKVNTIWMHIETASSCWYITVVVNDEYIFNEDSSSEHSGTTYGTFNFYINKNQPVSNVIISDEEIALKETIIEVDSSDVETTMTENDGTYSSASVGDYVLQILDTSTLYNLFGSDSKVTGMVAIAAPAFRTGDDIREIKCRTVDGEILIDYVIYDETGDPATLGIESEDFDASLADYIPTKAKQLDVASDMTFASLNGLKVGWVTA